VLDGNALHLADGGEAVDDFLMTFVAMKSFSILGQKRTGHKM
jgi:hypothetical protein